MIDKLFNKFGLTKKITRQKLRLFLEKYKQNELTLDIGCKDAPYEDLFPKRIGLDIAPGRGVDIIGSAEKMPFEDNKFNCILCTEVLEHIKDPIRAIAEMKRVLKPGGLLILTTRFVFPIHDAPLDFFRYTKYGLLELFKGWQIIELKEESQNFETIAILLQRLAYQADFKLNKIIKGLIFIIAKICSRLTFLVEREYSDITHHSQENNFLTSGYYLVAKK